ncbi:hypothetical protein QYF36_018631 [Acer negundo]|nr:hypothetical protein QYF36_018631 [Acer negundo]
MLDLNSASLIFLTLSICFISLFFLFFSASSNPSNKNPCPQSYPIIGNLPGFLRNHHRFHDWVAEMLSQTPSSTLQVNSFLNLSHGICTANPINVEHLLRANFQNYIKGSRYYNVLNELLGQDPAYLQNSSFVKAFDDAVEICSSRFMSPIPAVWKVKRVMNIGSEKRFKEAVKVINEYAMEIIISNENKEIGSNQDLLSRFMSASKSMEFQDQEQRRKFLRDIIISFILAGKDSTSTALTWFFWLIAGNPRCASLIRAELSSLPELELRPRTFSYDELKKLHYLHAALSESLRLFPPVPINSRLTVDKDVLPDGTYVGKGWFADYSAYAVGRMETVWGKDCREFKPERWLDADGAFQPSDQFRFPVFHCGPRMCLGKEMAYVQMKSIAAVLMHQFDIIALDGGANAEKMMNPPYSLSLLLKMRGGFPVQIKRRQQ